MGEKAIKISPGVYAQLKGLVDKGGLSYKAVADELIREGLLHLRSVEDIAQAVGADPNIRVAEENGVVYYCEECDTILDSEAEPEACPKCGTRFDWENKPSLGGGMGWLGWGLVGLAVLLVAGNQGRIAGK